MEERKYCICCGEDVPYHTVERNERHEIICSNCGFPLEIKESWKETKRRNDIAFVAEDSETVSKIIVNMLENKDFARKVIHCSNGAELLKEISDIYKEKSLDNNNLITGFAIIDLNMPIMDGLTAARAIRSLEANYKIRKIPFIFFSSIIANEKISSMLKSLAPAVYVNKGNIPDIGSLTRRVDILLKYVGEKYLESTT